MVVLGKGQIFKSRYGTIFTVVTNSTKTKVTCKCDCCGRNSEYSVDEMRQNKSICNICMQDMKKQEDIFNLSGLKVGDSIGTYEITHTGIKSKHEPIFNIKIKCNKCKDELDINVIQLSNLMGGKYKPKCKCSKQLKKQIGLIAELEDIPSKSNRGRYRNIEGWEFWGVETTNSNRLKYKYMCLKCGKIEYLSEKAYNTLSDKLECNNCKSIPSKSIILNTIDWVGHIKNGLRIEKVYTDDNGIKMATVVCLICSESYDIALATIVNSQDIVCKKCGKRKMMLKCPKCGQNHIQHTLSSLYSITEQSQMICTNTGKTYDKMELITEHEFLLDRDFLRSKYINQFDFESMRPARGPLAKMIKFKQGYVGTDGKYYTACMCAEHNKLLTLTDEEFNSYQHEFCHESRMISIKPKYKLK